MAEVLDCKHVGGFQGPFLGVPLRNLVFEVCIGVLLFMETPCGILCQDVACLSIPHLHLHDPKYLILGRVWCTKVMQDCSYQQHHEGSLRVIFGSCVDLQA